MTTVAEETLRWAHQEIIRSGVYPSAVSSGMIPDAAHIRTGGYHCSEDDLSIGGNDGDYSNTREGDRAADLTTRGEKACCADDISMSAADMKKHYNIVKRVYDNRSDPRRPYLNYINTWPGTGSAVRFDFVANRVLTADDSHKWHRHSDTKRKFQDLGGTAAKTAEAWKCARARVSVETGQSIAEWLEQEDPMPDYTEGQMKAFPWQYVGGGLIDPTKSTLYQFTQMAIGVNTLMQKVDLLMLEAQDADADRTAIAAKLIEIDNEAEANRVALEASIEDIPEDTAALLGSLDAAELEDLLRNGASDEVLAELAVRLAQPAG